MNAAASKNGDDFAPERARLFTEIASLKEQRNKLQAELAECRRENRRLIAQLGGDK